MCWGISLNNRSRISKNSVPKPRPRPPSAFAKSPPLPAAKKGPRLSPAGLQELRALYAAQAPGILEKQAQILAHERCIAESVHAAFGLTAEDLALLRASQPPRMPPGW